MYLKCQMLYSLDDEMLARKDQLSIRDMDFLRPKPTTPPLFP